MSRFAIFLTVVLLIWAAMHAYVFWRLATIPGVARAVPSRALIATAVVLFVSYPLARFLEGKVPDSAVLPLEYLAANWIGLVFLFVCAFLTVDVVTLGGVLFSKTVGQVRAGGAGVALLLGVIALVQGHRPPVVSNHEIVLPELPAERSGTVVVCVSDLHLGTLLGQRWLERLVSRVNALEPDLIVAVGDVVDGNALRVQHLAPVFRRLQAPLGVWGVSGNHEFYAGLPECMVFFEKAGIRMLRDETKEIVPGLVLAGVDDLTAREQLGTADKWMSQALAGRPAGATIVLSHTPWEAEAAAEAGAALMLSGHTHKGQIWPFTYLVRTRYPLVSGRYEINGMKVLVGRGTGTWGPRMRLWQRAEIMRITLRSSAA